MIGIWSNGPRSSTNESSFAGASAPYNCAEARSMGIAPMYAGQPNYRPELDADHDGVACEPLPRKHRFD